MVKHLFEHQGCWGPFVDVIARAFGVSAAGLSHEGFEPSACQRLVAVEPRIFGFESGGGPRRSIHGAIVLRCKKRHKRIERVPARKAVSGQAIVDFRGERALVVVKEADAAVVSMDIDERKSTEKTAAHLPGQFFAIRGVVGLFHCDGSLSSFSLGGGLGTLWREGEQPSGICGFTGRMVGVATHRYSGSAPLAAGGGPTCHRCWGLFTLRQTWVWSGGEVAVSGADVSVMHPRLRFG